MKIEWKEVNIKGRKIKALLTIKESADRELLKGLYFDWKNVNDRLKNISTSGINLPEAISENAFELFFLDFSEGDGSFKVYDIKPDWIYKHKVNKSQTFEEQQKQNRRPRFSITENIINLKKLKPIKICRL